jgi:hypothetical protein
MLYISGCLIQDHMLNRNIENHPGKPYYHKAYGSALLSNYRTLVLGWWLVLVEVGPEGGRRHNSPLIVSLPSRLSQSYFHYSRRGKETRKYLTKQEMKQGNTQQTEDRRFGNCLRCSLLIKCVRSITRGSLFIGVPWVWSFASITHFPFLTNSFKHFTRA